MPAGTFPALRVAVDRHRQLERYLFRFAKNRSGIFTATAELKLPEAVLTRPRAVDDWSIKDVLAVLIVWEEALLAWYAAGRRGRAAALPRGADRTVPDPGRFARLRRWSVGQTVTEFQRSHRKIVDTLQRSGRAGALEELVASTLAARYTWAKTHMQRLASARAAGMPQRRPVIETIKRERKRPGAAAERRRAKVPDLR